MALIPQNTEIPKCFKVICYCTVIGEQSIVCLIVFKIEMKIVIEIPEKVKRSPKQTVWNLFISLAEYNFVLSSKHKIRDFLLVNFPTFYRLYQKAKYTTDNSSCGLEDCVKIVINLCPHLLKTFIITHCFISPSLNIKEVWSMFLKKEHLYPIKTYENVFQQLGIISEYKMKIFCFFENVKYQMVTTPSKTQYCEYLFKSFAGGSKCLVWFGFLYMFYFILWYTIESWMKKNRRLLYVLGFTK